MPYAEFVEWATYFRIQEEEKAGISTKPQTQEEMKNVLKAFCKRK